MGKIFKLTVVCMFLNLNLYAENMFIDVSTGYSHIPYSKKDKQGSIDIDKLDENAYSYDLAFGYRYNKNLFSTINYQYSKLDEIEFDDYYVTLNYQFKHKMNPYLGLFVGKSFLHYKKDILNSSKTKDYTSGSFLYGFQAGLEYKFSTNLSFVPRLIYSRTNHGTNLNSSPAKSHIEHNSKRQVLFGLRFNF